jgi:hypothetical protein
MIPNTNIDTIEVRTEPGLTWRIDMDKDVIEGMTDDQIAVMQAIYLILNIERYEYEIYPWGYGVELYDLIGQPKDYAIPEIKRRISEALLVDDRITGVSDFSFTWGRGSVATSFTVNTIYGDIESQREVTI